MMNTSDLTAMCMALDLKEEYHAADGDAVISACFLLGLEIIPDERYPGAIDICMENECIASYSGNLLYFGSHCEKELRHWNVYNFNKITTKEQIVDDLTMCKKKVEVSVSVI